MLALSPRRLLLRREEAASFVAIDGSVAGLVALADTARPEAASAVAALRAMGVGVAMVTGDPGGRRRSRWPRPWA